MLTQKIHVIPQRNQKDLKNKLAKISFSSKKLHNSNRKTNNFVKERNFELSNHNSQEIVGEEKIAMKRKSPSIKNKNYLWIIFFIKKFVVILKAKTVETKLKKFQTYHEGIFCDLTYFRNKETNKKIKLNNPLYKLNVNFKNIFFYNQKKIREINIFIKLQII